MLRKFPTLRALAQVAKIALVLTTTGFTGMVAFVRPPGPDTLGYIGPRRESPVQTGWAPPPWFPEETSRDLWVLDDLDKAPTERWGPYVKARSGIVADLDKGEVLWARDPDSPRSIASLTKLVSSLALVAADADLDREVCVSLEQWPTRPGARSKFETGDCHVGWEYLGAALVASDNRGAFAMPAIADEDYYVFVDRMQDVAEDIGMTNSSFVDPAGLEDENMASARDMLKAVTAVSLHPTLSGVASAPGWLIETSRGSRWLGTTNRLLALSLTPPKKRFVPPPYETIAAKTGYTDTAYYCFTTVVRSQLTGRLLAASVLAAPNNSSRFEDVLSMLRWADTRD
jgi:D-alanyl-D-alanine endopeptidase (penicillin-binding protein 7)